jgi:ribosomal subunit interface protein
MQVQVSGKQVDVGEALGSRISQELEEGVGKYFERGGQDAEVVVSKDGSWVQGGLLGPSRLRPVLVTTGLGGDAHSAFTDSLDKLEKRVRRYKRRLKDHHIGPKGLSPEKTEMAAASVARSIVLRNPDDVEDDVVRRRGLVRRTSARRHGHRRDRGRDPHHHGRPRGAELDMTGYPVVLFRNAAHGGAVGGLPPAGRQCGLDRPRADSPVSTALKPKPMGTLP